MRGAWTAEEPISGCGVDTHTRVQTEDETDGFRVLTPRVETSNGPHLINRCLRHQTLFFCMPYNFGRGKSRRMSPVLRVYHVKLIAPKQQLCLSEHV